MVNPGCPWEELPNSDRVVREEAFPGILGVRDGNGESDEGHARPDEDHARPNDGDAESNERDGRKRVPGGTLDDGHR